MRMIVPATFDSDDSDTEVFSIDDWVGPIPGGERSATLWVVPHGTEPPSAVAAAGWLAVLFGFSI